VEDSFMPKKSWTKEEINKLKKLAENGLSTKEIVTFMPDRTLIAIRRKAGLEKITISYKNEWKQNELDLLIKYINENKTDKEIGTLLNRTEQSVSTKRVKMRLLFRVKTWDKEEVGKLKEFKDKGMNNCEIAEQLNRTISGINHKISREKIKKPVFWTKEKVDFLIKSVNKDLPISEISKYLDISYATIYSTIKKLKLQMLISRKRDETKLFLNKFKNHIAAISINKRFYAVMSRAKRKNIAFNLDREYLLSLYDQQKGLCYYSGLRMEINGKKSGYHSKFVISVDRIVPELGYTKGNIVLCCNCINTMRGMSTINEFIKLCKIIVDFNQHILCGFSKNNLTKTNQLL